MYKTRFPPVSDSVYVETVLRTLKKQKKEKNYIMSA